MGKANFSEESKRDAVRQITERGYPVAGVSQRLGASQRKMDLRLVSPVNGKRRPWLPLQLRDGASENGYARDLAERALAHTVKSVTEAAYHRTDRLDRRPTMMLECERHCLGYANATNDPRTKVARMGSSPSLTKRIL